MDSLTPTQKSVVERVHNEENEKRKHIIFRLSGAHSYGFASTDSDVDLKAVHVESTARLVGLNQPKTSAERMQTIDGVEIDYSSNELGMVLSGCLKGSGNMIERVLGDSMLESGWASEMRPIVKRSLSKRLYAHYNGFATQQGIAAHKKPTAKHVLYVLRTALTGAHLLRTRELCVDVAELFDEYGFLGFKAALDLVEIKRSKERVELSVNEFQHWVPMMDKAMGVLSNERNDSRLPDDAPNFDEANAWLVSIRQRNWAA